jgi:hypothetical protein
LFHQKQCVERDTLSWMEGEGSDTLYAWGYRQETHTDKILPQIYFLNNPSNMENINIQKLLEMHKWDEYHTVYKKEFSFEEQKREVY